MVDYFFYELGYDNVKIFNGADNTSDVLGSYNSSHEPSMEGFWLASSANDLIIQFVSDIKGRQKGFHMEYDIIEIDG